MGFVQGKSSSGCVVGVIHKFIYVKHALAIGGGTTKGPTGATLPGGSRLHKFAMELADDIVYMARKNGNAYYKVRNKLLICFMGYELYKIQDGGTRDGCTEITRVSA